jgi:ABC-type glycerol-3-phosphate transport system substrate-binding protein
MVRWLALLVAALALVAVGCGGSDDESSAADETTVTETTTTTSDETSSDDLDSFDFADEDCQALVAAYVSLSGALAGASGGGSSDFADEIEEFTELAEKVPDEIREDVETVAAAYSQYIDVIQDAGIEPGEIPTAEQAQQLQNALQSVGEADVTAAGERLSAWTTENCTG